MLLAVAMATAACIGGDDGAATSSSDPNSAPSSAATAGASPSTSATPTAAPSPTPTPTPDPDLVDGPAPSSTAEGRALRVDQVRRVGDAVAVDLVLALADPSSVSFDPGDVDVTTNTGLAIEVNGEERILAADTATAITLDLPLPDEPVRDLRLAYRDMEVVAAIPDQDGRLRWDPAPRRQAGFPGTVLRDDSVVTVVPETIRTEGLVTEVTGAVGAGSTGYEPTLCRGPSHDCRLEDSAGAAFPLLGDGVRLAGSGRASGTLRFLGEIPADQTDLRLILDGSGSCAICADPDLEAEVTLPMAESSSVRAVAGRLARDPVALDEDLVDEDSGATITLEELVPLSDHVQVRVSATGGSDLLSLAATDAGLVEDDGYVHDLLVPADADLDVPAGGDLATTLVFASPLPPDTTTLELRLGPDLRLVTTIDVPAADDDASESATPATIDRNVTSQTEEASPTAPPDPRPSASEGAVAAVDVQDLPTTQFRPLGSVRSAIDGVTSGGDSTSSDEVEPDAAAEAERSLEDLGAEHTPDGLIVTLPETVLFDFDSADLRPAADDTLAEVAKVLAYYDQAEIGVEGHTDGKGERDYNQDLSERRAQAVADALADAGVGAGRMAVVGYGMDRPIAPNTAADGSDDPDGRQRNRRVEIVLREP